MLNPTGLIHGHYECRSFNQTIPILNDILALEVVGENSSKKFSNIRIRTGGLSSMKTAPTRPSSRCEIITVCG